MIHCPTYDTPEIYRGYAIWFEQSAYFGRLCAFQRETRDAECDPVETARNSDEAKRVIDDIIEEEQE